MKNILVTGGEGFIGKHLVKRLKSLGHNVMTVDLSVDADYTFDICDATNFHVLDNIDIDIVYHLAAQSYGRGSLDDPHKDLDWNALGTLNVCLYAWKNNINKIVYTSTMAVYGNGDLSKETDNLNPLSNYACSKLCGEFYIKRFAEYGIDYTIFRVFNTYGPGQDLSNKNKGIVNAFISQVMNDTTINVTGSLDRYRDLTYVDDMVNALILGLDNKTRNETINACSSVKTHIGDLINTIILLSGKDISLFKINNIGGHSGDQHGSTGDNSKLKSLGWKLETPLTDGLKKVWSSL